MNLNRSSFRTQNKHHALFSELKQVCHIVVHSKKTAMTASAAEYMHLMVPEEPSGTIIFSVVQFSHRFQG